LFGAGAASPALATEPAFATIACSPIASGRLRGIDTAAAAALPDVLSILRTTTDDELSYEGEPLLLIIASRKEAAEEAARLCAIRFESRPAVLTTAAALPSAYTPQAAAAFCEERGDPDGAIGELQLTAGAQVAIVRQTYRTFAEPIAVDKPSSLVASLVALAERTVKRKVQLVLSPAQSALLVGQRPETLQTLTLAAGRDGRLRALTHNAVSDTAMRAEYVEPCTQLSRHLYETETLRLSHKLVRKNLAPRGGPEVIAPGLLPGLFALEQATDELAFALRLDPLRLRRLYYTEVDPASQKPWFEKRLRECYRLGEEAIGWSSRKLEPRALREGQKLEELDKLLGLGMASTMGPPQLFGSEVAAPWGAHFCRVTVDARSGAVQMVRLITVLDAGGASSKSLFGAAEAGVAYALKALFQGGAPAARQHQVTLLEAETTVSLRPRRSVEWSPQVIRDVAAAGVAAAVASALHNATGIRYRELPIRPVQVVG
jgi:CO/xanthine dehydrogenase Mo-binding subunit